MSVKKLKGMQLYLFYNEKEIQYVQHWMLKSDEYLLNCFRAIYNQQTALERHAGMTIDANMRGFMRTDSITLSALGEKRKFTEDEIRFIRKRMMKYARQIVMLQRERLR